MHFKVTHTLLICINCNVEIIEEQLASFKLWGEDLKYQSWVEMSPSAKTQDKKERDKLKKFEKRLVAVATYRIFVIKKATFGGARHVCISIIIYYILYVTLVA